jgi:MFS family permease
VPPTIGLVQQASNLGQFTGPLVLGLWVEHFGWRAAPAIVAPAALFGLGVAFMIRGAMYCQAGIRQGQLEGKSK